MLLHPVTVSSHSSSTLPANSRAAVMDAPGRSAVVGCSCENWASPRQWRSSLHRGVNSFSLAVPRAQDETMRPSRWHHCRAGRLGRGLDDLGRSGAGSLPWRGLSVLSEGSQGDNNFSRIRGRHGIGELKAIAKRSAPSTYQGSGSERGGCRSAPHSARVVASRRCAVIAGGIGHRRQHHDRRPGYAYRTRQAWVAMVFQNSRSTASPWQKISFCCR